MDLPFRRRVRRRAVRAVGGFLEAEQLRQLVLNHHGESSSGSDIVESAESGSDNDSDNTDDRQTDHENDNGERVPQNLVDDNDDENNNAPENADNVNDNGSDHDGGEMDEAAALDVPLNEREKEEFLVRSLRKFGSSGGVLSMSKLDELLGDLSTAFPSVPKSYKTLLSTARNINILHGINFKFWYKGIRVNLDQMDLHLYLQRFGKIKIDVNMDGLPLSKTGGSKLKFWPILGKLKETENKPFNIAVFCGETDPKDVDMFLGDLTLELHDLYENGYNYQGENHDFEVESFILDAPARSLVKCCVQHGGYGACEKCEVRGMFVEGRMNYVVVNPEVRLRTDGSFANQEDRLHHCGQSPLTLVNGIGLVSNFRLDTMHLLYKGAFSRLLDVLLTWEGPWNFTADGIRAISEKMLGFVVTCPEDFNRKPRKVEDYYKYKATELRRLLLYDGVVAFKDEMEDNIFKLFCLLHSAIYILASRHLLVNYLAEAEIFLKNFVTFSAEVFGNHFVVYNIHSLLHLVDECRMHGVIENFSAFCYENHLKSIKETLRSGYLPLEQLVKRDSERSNNIPVKIKSTENSVQLSQQHIDPCELEMGDQFKKAIVNNVVFKIGKKNGCFITTDKRVGVLKNIVRRDRNTVCFIAECFTNYEDLYNYPMDSSHLGIFSFVLIKFESDGSLEVAKKSWISFSEDDAKFLCKWPDQTLTPKQLTSLVTKPDAPTDGWKSHACEVINSYENYLDAHLGRKNRVNNSNYETEKELGAGLRQKKRRQFHDEVSVEGKGNKMLKPAPKKQAVSSCVPVAPTIVVTSRSTAQSSTSGRNQERTKTPIPAPVSVIVSNSTNKQIRIQESKKTINLIRKDKGTKADNIQELKKIMKENQSTINFKRSASSSASASVSRPPSPDKEEGTPSVSDEEEETPSSLPVKEDRNPLSPLSDKEDSGSDSDILSEIYSDSKSKKSKISSSDSEFECENEVQNLKSTHKIKLRSAPKKSSEATHSRSRSPSPSLLSSPERMSAPPSSAKKSSEANHSRSRSPSPLYSSGRKSTPPPSTSQTSISDDKFKIKVLTLLSELNQKTETCLATSTRMAYHVIPNEASLCKPRVGPGLPILDLENVPKMEEELSKSATNLANVALYLSSFVDKDPTLERQSAMKVMEQVFGNCVAKYYSMDGKKGKKSFSTLLLWKAVKTAISHKIDDTNYAAAKDGVMSWLKYAKQRTQEDAPDSKV